jgi:threonine dehydrogenase-like Zn-dependent dehydrogenase
MKGLAMIEKGVVGWIEKDYPVCGDIDAIVRPIAISPCSSDVHNVEMGYIGRNRIIGHEGVAEVISVGKAVKDFKPGDIVIVPAITPNWRSLAVQQGFHQHCNGLMKGNALSSHLDGLLAEYAMIPDADMNLALKPGEISLNSAVMISDMVSSGFYGAELAEVGFGDTVVVIGIGPVGLMAVVGAKLRGAGRIIAIGSRPCCIEAAKYYGATDIINYKEGDITKQVFSLTNKEGADRCIIAGGDDNALAQAIAMVRWGGNIGNVNYFTTAGDLSIPNARWGYGMGNKTIKSGLCTGGRMRTEGLASMVKYGRVDPEPLITHVFHGLDKAKEAYELMAKKPPELIKPVVICE